MKSKEGYLVIDHRASPGLTEKEAPGIPLVARQGFYEADTMACSHCQVMVVKHPLRDRARGYCRTCDSFICDNCSLVLTQTLKCRTLKQHLDEIQEANFKEDLKNG